MSGAFMFADADPAALADKARAAFRAGLLGIASFGWSTLAQIVEASEQDRVAVTDLLARQLMTHCGAPSLAQARAAAEEEIAFAASLCTHPADTLIAVHRSDDNGEVREAFRTLRPRDGPKPLRAFAFLEAEDDEAPDETIDLAALAQEKKK